MKGGSAAPFLWPYRSEVIASLMTPRASGDSSFSHFVSPLTPGGTMRDHRKWGERHKRTSEGGDAADNSVLIIEVERRKRLRSLETFLNAARPYDGLRSSASPSRLRGWGGLR